MVGIISIKVIEIIMQEDYSAMAIMGVEHSTELVRSYLNESC